MSRTIYNASISCLKLLWFTQFRQLPNGNYQNPHCKGIIQLVDGEWVVEYGEFCSVNQELDDAKHDLWEAYSKEVILK